ncbi:hypothetical protein VP01_5872g2 [Puccinia sorghi]|uniref:Uncharacterized protein n=1 Tax=Puccinia sorghi TaxID=27349 RepID=A0A0L6UK03_9BASI|nr:hypothetical protein VP01_5872g2 [Puccinia sorghi]
MVARILLLKSYMCLKDSNHLQFNQNTWLHIMEVLLENNTKWLFRQPHVPINELRYETNMGSLMCYWRHNLEGHIRTFMYHIVKMSGRWENKPKFPMLLHLPDSIRHYNGVIRNSSIHSNRQSPGRDLASSFSYYQLLLPKSENFLRTIQSFKNLWAIIHPNLSDQKYFHFCMEIKAKRIIMKAIKISSEDVIRDGYFVLVNPSAS